MRLGKNLYCISLLVLLLQPLLISVLSVRAQGVEIPTPREETWVKVSNEGVGYYGYTDWNPLAIPYACYEALNAFVGEFLWYDDSATGERTWWLVTGVDYSADFEQVTFHVRQGVHWNDGEPFTSKDIKFTVELIKKYPECGQNTFMNEWIDTVETPDDYTVVFNLKKPNLGRFDRSPWTAGIWNFLLILPEHIWKDIEDPLSFENNENPVFTGPYKHFMTIPESNMFVLIRDENYWGKALGYFPEPKYIVIRGLAPVDIEYLSWVQGTVDYIDTGYIPNELVDIGMASGDPNVTYYDVPDPAANSLIINCEKYPGSVPELRWAMSYCINKQKLADFVPTGAALACTGPFALGWNVEKYVNKWKDVFMKYGNLGEYNLTKAAEILDSLDFKDRNGDGIRETPNGTKLSLQLTFSDSPEMAYYSEVAQDITDNFAKVGMEIIYRRMSHAEIFDRRKYGDFDLVLWVHAGGQWAANDPLQFLNMWHSKYYAPIGQVGTGGGSGDSRFHDPELDTIIDQMESMPPTDPEYENLANRAFDIYMKNLPLIPIFQSLNRFLLNTKYWTGFPTPKLAWIQCWDPDIKWVIENLVPTGAVQPIEMSYVWFTAPVPAFTGADKRTYGPFSSGDYTRIPKEDADRLVEEGVASFQAPTPGLSEILSTLDTLSEGVSNLETSATEMSESVTGISDSLAALSGQTTMLTTGLVIEAVAIIVLAVVILMRRK